MPLQGTVAITDLNWYEFLLNKSPRWDEVNFWTPSSYWSFKAPEFSPFLFKLKSPNKYIVGFGYFARYSALPIWLAWECFGEKNGCTSIQEMNRKIDTIRENINFRSVQSVSQIGCIVLVNVTLFPKAKWIPQPVDWPGPNLRPMKYDLERGEGERVWQACLEASGQKALGPDVPKILVAESPNQYGEPRLVQQRLGQGAFRVSVMEAYGRACAATGEHSLPALEAAHIKPFALDGPHNINNGLLLRADFHRLFEQGYLTITPDFHLEVSNRLRADFNNGHSYYPKHGSRISIPSMEGDRPSRQMLEWHNQNVFLG